MTKFAYQLHQVEYFYARTRALYLPQLDIHADQVTAIIGANGSGKSTLLNLLALLEFPINGTLNFFAATTSVKSAVSVRRQIGFLPQKPYLLAGTVADNLNLSLKIHQVHKSQRQAKIQHILSKLNLLHLHNQSAKKLSGGELQKVALARALITEPKVLLMDEPFSYLDAASSLQLEQFMQSYANFSTATTLIFSTHNRLQGLALADRTISLDKGQQLATPLINLFTGKVLNSVFYTTAKLAFHGIKLSPHFQQVSIDPHQINLHKYKLNIVDIHQYQGHVVALIAISNMIRVTVQAQEEFEILLNLSVFTQLSLHLGEIIWLSFSSNAVVFF